MQASMKAPYCVNVHVIAVSLHVVGKVIYSALIAVALLKHSHLSSSSFVKSTSKASEKEDSNDGDIGSAHQTKKWVEINHRRVIFKKEPGSHGLGECYPRRWPLDCIPHFLTTWGKNERPRVFGGGHGRWFSNPFITKVLRSRRIRFLSKAVLAFYMKKISAYVVHEPMITNACWCFKHGPGLSKISMFSSSAVNKRYGRRFRTKLVIRFVKATWVLQHIYLFWRIVVGLSWACLKWNFQ